MHAYDHMFAVHRVEKWFYKTKEFTDSIMRNAFFFCDGADSSKKNDFSQSDHYDKKKKQSPKIGEEHS